MMNRSGRTGGPLKVWDRRFNESTRGRLVALLRQDTLTVEEMAKALGITDNAVRAQLTSLERDGLIRQHGLRRGAGKPSYSYALNPEFEPALSRAYLPFLVRLLRELALRLPEKELIEVLRDLGRRWANELGRSSGDAKSRVAAASALLNELGGVTEVEERDGRLSIRGRSCPLAVAVQENPRICVAIEALLSELLGTTVREHCDRNGERARCCFEVVGGTAGRRGSREAGEQVNRKPAG
jgi:predicted ArsR family transcriptional regulator